LTVQGDVVYGSGSFDFPDPKAGLSELSSYKATLTLSFEGTRDGQPEGWSNTYVMLAAAQPAARQLTIKKTRDPSQPGSVLMAELDGVDYEVRGGNVCAATFIEAGNSLGARLEPAGLLNFVIGAEQAGTATVNKAAANHYTFDQSALGQSGLAPSTGEMWVASKGGYLVKYLLTTKGNADYFGDGVEGTLTWDYELTDVNKPVKIQIPKDCPGGKVNAPLLSDASNVVDLPGELSFDTSTGPAEVAAFYQKQLPDLGWKLQNGADITDAKALLDFQQGAQDLTVFITTDAGVTSVQLMLGSVQK